MYPEIKVIKNNPTFACQAKLIPNIVYSPATGQKLYIMQPWAVDALESKPKFPLIVFLQGSGWTFPDVNYEIPQLSQIARMGYVVATIEHRNSLDGNPFPAYLSDAKTAIRFLRANAEKYGIDKDRVAFFGTSSGGNTSLLVGLTGDDEEFKTEEYANESDAVKAVLECFGPADLPKMVMGLIDDEYGKRLFKSLAGENDPYVIMDKMSPVNYVKSGRKYPPFLIMQGNNDPLVPYDQSLEMYHKLIDAGIDAQMVCIDGAEHEGTFWSPELWEIITEFIKKNL